MQDNQSQKQSLALPIAIVLAGALVGAGIFMSGKNETSLPSNPAQANTPREINLKSLSSTDHVRGDLDARVVLVEYSDTECPFCKRFHSTLQSLVGQYEQDELSWVYRHFPIAQLHPEAAKQAEAQECAAEQGKFWEFTDRLYEVTPGNNGLAITELPLIAQTVGLDVSVFNTCLASGRHATLVNQSISDAQNAGADGTPTSFLVLKSPLTQKVADDITLASASFTMPDGRSLVNINKERNIISMAGALPLDFIKGVVDISLGK